MLFFFLLSLSLSLSLSQHDAIIQTEYLHWWIGSDSGRGRWSRYRPCSSVRAWPCLTSLRRKLSWLSVQCDIFDHNKAECCLLWWSRNGEMLEKKPIVIECRQLYYPMQSLQFIMFPCNLMMSVRTFSNQMILNTLETSWAGFRKCAVGLVCEFSYLISCLFVWQGTRAGHPSPEACNGGCSRGGTVRFRCSPFKVSRVVFIPSPVCVRSKEDLFRDI